jgi:ferritin-like protein
MASENLHEDPSQLRPETIDTHRAIRSLMEELEAVDWYNQRVDATSDPELKEILAHNRDEEKEHAMMVLEWLRRHDAKFDEMIGIYINAPGSIIHAEEAATGEGGSADAGGGGSGAGDGSLGIGSLKTPRNAGAKS